MMQRLKRNLKSNKKGAIADIFVFIALSIIITVVIGMLWYSIGEVNTVFEGMTDSGSGSVVFNASNYSARSLGIVYDQLDTLNFVGFSILFGMILSIFISSFFVRGHPVFLIIYIFVTILAIIVSVPVSNAYEAAFMDSTQPYYSTFQELTAPNFILLNLPIVVTVVSLIGALLLFIVLRTGSDLGGIAI